jgi:hypothetical protein
VFFLVLLPPSKIKVSTPAHAPVEWLVRGRLVVDWGMGAGRPMEGRMCGKDRQVAIDLASNFQKLWKMKKKS